MLRNKLFIQDFDKSFAVIIAAQLLHNYCEQLR